MKTNWDKTCEAYLNNSLSEEERKEVDQILKKDSEARARFNSHKLAKEALIQLQVNNFMSSLKDTDPSNNSPKWKFPLWGWILVSLISIGVISAVLIKEYRALQPQQLAINYSVDQTSLTIRNIEENTISAEDDAYFQLMHKGLSFLNENKPKEARKIFKSIPPTSELYIQNTEWMIAMTHFVESGRNHPIFKTTLAKITENPQHNMYPKALAMEDKLNGIWSFLFR